MSKRNLEKEDFATRQFVSVIVPTRNEEAFLDRCLSSIAEQDFGKDNLEVLIVDGMSDDGSCEIIEKYKEKYPNFRLLDNPKKIVPVALNIGIKNSKGDVIVRVDAHCYLKSDYISKCVEYLSETGVSNVGGLMRPVASGYVGKAIAFVHNSRFGLGGGKFHYLEKEEYVDTVYLGAYPRQVFEEVGLFDEKLARNQDIEFNYRIRKSGGKILLTPAIKSHYYCRTSLADFWRQNFKNGVWNIKTTRLSPGTLSIRHFVPFVFIMSLIISGITAFLWIGGVIAFTAILASYALLAFLYSLQVAYKNGFRYLLIMAIVFLVAHISYGLGTFWGIMRYKN